MKNYNYHILILLVKIEELLLIKTKAKPYIPKVLYLHEHSEIFFF